MLGDAAKATEHTERALALLRRAKLPEDHPNVRRLRAALRR